jgi:hypothetical protein
VAFINFLAALFGAGLGFGLAFFIAATILNKNNNIGDSVGSASLYTGGVVMTDKDNAMKLNDKNLYIVSHKPKKPDYPTVPTGKGLVERSRDQ